jgi:hypothetical protein
MRASKKNLQAKALLNKKSLGGGEFVKKTVLILSAVLILVISVPLVFGALTFQRDIGTSGVTAAYNWNSPNIGLTSWTTSRTNVQLSITANSSRELTGINWGTGIRVININYSRGYHESTHAIVTLTNVGNVPVNVNLKLVSYSITIPQTTITAFWGMSGDAGPNITLQPGQTVHPALTLAIVSNTPAYGATPFNVHVVITATQT